MKVLGCPFTLLHHIFHSKEYVTEVELVSVQATREFTGSQVLQVDHITLRNPSNSFMKVTNVKRMTYRFVKFRINVLPRRKEKIIHRLVYSFSCRCC